MDVILYHNQNWLHFAHPVRVLTAHRLDEVVPCLETAEQSGLFAAGFVAYEAAPAFDSALTTYPPGDFPLVRLGLFEAPRVLTEWDSGGGPHTAVAELHPSVNRQAFGEVIDKIKHHIAAGATYQVNYTYRLRCPFTGDARAFFKTLVEDQRLEHAAFVDTGDYAVCSASPELFFRRDQGKIISRPMKGTARRGLTWAADRKAAEDLRHSEKDRAENIMIVDMIRNDIGRVARPGTVKTPVRFAIEKYPTVWQMTSTVTGDAPESSISEIFKALFPCSSITGAPKAKTMELIRNLETDPRHIYTGSVGFMSPTGDACFNVAIRTALIDRKKQQLEFGVGGGIVWDSQADAEFEETLTKARVLTQPRATFDLLESMLFSPEGEFFLLNEHLNRLARSAEYFDFAVDRERVEKRLVEAGEDCRGGACKVRLLVSKDGTVNIQATPLTSPVDSESDMPVIHVALAQKPVDSTDIFLYHKTTCRHVYTDALAAFHKTGEKRQKASMGDVSNIHGRSSHENATVWLDDVILWNERGEVTESCLANVVIRRDGQLVTPPVTSGLLAGTFREHLLARGAVTEAVITVDELKKADEIYLVNSVRRWRRAVFAD